MRKALIIALTCIAASLPAADAGKSFETYSVVTPDADALVSMAKSIGGSESRIVFDESSSKLLVYAAPDVHASIRRIMDEVNMMPQNIILEVVIHEPGRFSASSASLGLSGSAAISESGIKGRIHARPSASAHSGRSDTLTSQKLVLQSGREAVITVGKEVPFINYLLLLGRNWGYIQQEVEIKKVGASLRAKATIVGNTDMITVTLTPELSGLVGRTITRIQYTKVATTVTVRNGETITLGSFGNNGSFYKKFLAGFTGGDESRAINITLSANIMQPTGRLK